MPYKDPEARLACGRRCWQTMKADPARWADRKAKAAEYRKRYQRERPEIHRAGNKRHASARRAMLAEIKMARGCIDCGYRIAPEALHFDHVDPSTKVAEVGAMCNSTLERVFAEIAKCVIRCANCHAIRTARQARGQVA